MRKWRRLNGDPLPDIRASVAKTILKEKANGHRLKVCIGTDSQKRAGVAEFATVIVFLREKKGGFMFIHKQSVARKMSIKERMLHEVAQSIEVAYQLCDLFDKHDVDLEVHADINTNPHFESNVALREATGYILGMGFSFKAKPDAFASSSCADRMV